MRLPAAIFLSSLSVVLIFAFFGVVIGFWDTDYFAPMVIVVFGYTVVLVVIFGLPVHYILASRGLERAWHYAAAGFFIATLLALANDLIIVGQVYWDTLESMLLFGPLGSLVSLLFWKLAVSHKPTDNELKYSDDE